MISSTTEIQEKGSGLLSDYNAKMKDLQRAYRDAKGIDKNTCYLFILDKSGAGKNRDAQGFMPRGNQFGYIFTDGLSTKDINQIIAHELGHGVWKLAHTFNKSYGEKLAQGTTDNLMDYSGKTHIAKWQWDIMAQPALLVNPLEGDEKGMAKSISDAIDYDKLVKWLRDNQGKTVSYNFQDFVSQETYASVTMGSVHSVPVNKQYTETVDGKEVTLALRGVLSTKEGTVTLTAANTNTIANFFIISTMYVAKIIIYQRRKV